ncbi:anoctamin-10 isoform X2 [Chrysoperla carnea]|nr:anoctamin-10 isoform X2 [Chrysoperla carnea]XP_044726730.1 anoctamin-10 isoform X2 [Chrysoperla carnea]
MTQYQQPLIENEIMESISEPESSDESQTYPQTYIVIKFAENVNKTTLKWIVDKIKGNKRNGGAELLIQKQPYDKNEGLILHISATKIKFLELAEEMEIVKQDRFGVMREFTVDQLEDFLEPGMHVDDFLTTSERQTIVKHELDNLRALVEDVHIPGYVLYKLYEGQSIIELCVQVGLIELIYPLHDLEELKKLGSIWYKPLVLKQQPFENIRTYFGEAIALYFIFLGFYTMALILPTALGIIQTFLSSETLPFFCIFNVIWATVFLEVWKRKCSEYAYKWGTIGMTSLDEPRASYYGQMIKDPVSGRVTPQYPRWKTYTKMYCISLPIVIFCMSIGFGIMLVSFWVEDYIKTKVSPLNEYRMYLVYLPSVIYAALVYVMNFYYRKLATRLTEWENHRTQSQYDRHRVTKLLLFEFVNNFMALFYIAFVIQDIEMLQNQLVIMLIILQIINNFQEAILPLIVRIYVEKVKNLKRYLKKQVQDAFGSLSKTKTDRNSMGDGIHEDQFDYIQTLHVDDSRIQAANAEGKMESYEGTYDDYLEMFMQFGYVVLFSSVYPLAAFWAILNNIFEIRADAFKLCMVYQRPLSRKVKDIGAFQKAFEVLGALSIVTNCGLIAINLKNKSHTKIEMNVQWILFFVFLEHLLLLIQYIIHLVIPDKPEWVRVALARRNYESKQALKHERASKSRRILVRKFNTEHTKKRLHEHSI